MPVATPPRPRKAGPAAPGWPDDPEVRLMLRVQRGDDESFAELQRLYGARIFGYFCRQLKDRAEAEDLTQEVFLRLYRSRGRYQPRARFATWIFHITQNVARNALRSRRRHPCVQLAGAPGDRNLLEALLSDPGGDPSRPLERAELAGVVRAAVAELAGRQRAAVELHQFHNRTYAEVAAELDMTPKAAKSLLYRARNQLREALTPFMSEAPLGRRPAGG
jgi:RNA polymerase sigma-70 factor (ECF subfamily)